LNNCSTQNILFIRYPVHALLPLRYAILTPNRIKIYKAADLSLNSLHAVVQELAPVQHLSAVSASSPRLRIVFDGLRQQQEQDLAVREFLGHYSTDFPIIFLSSEGVCDFLC
jgi:hypothetical protein